MKQKPWLIGLILSLVSIVGFGQCSSPDDDNMATLLGAYALLNGGGSTSGNSASVDAASTAASSSTLNVSSRISVIPAKSTEGSSALIASKLLPGRFVPAKNRVSLRSLFSRDPSTDSRLMTDASETFVMDPISMEMGESNFLFGVMSQVTKAARTHLEENGVATDEDGFYSEDDLNTYFPAVVIIKEVKDFSMGQDFYSSDEKGIKTQTWIVDMTNDPERGMVVEAWGETDSFGLIAKYYIEGSGYGEETSNGLVSVTTLMKSAQTVVFSYYNDYDLETGDPIGDPITQEYSWGLDVSRKRLYPAGTTDFETTSPVQDDILTYAPALDLNGGAGFKVSPAALKSLRKSKSSISPRSIARAPGETTDFGDWTRIVVDNPSSEDATGSMAIHIYGFGGFANFDSSNIYAKIQEPDWDNFDEITGEIGSIARELSLSRDNPHSIVNSYGVYDSDGNAMELNTGFPFQADTDGDGSYESEGWASYWGVDAWNTSTYSQVQLEEGDTIQETKYDGTEGDIYTIGVIPGRLYKLVKRTIDLSEFDGVRLIYSDWEYNSGMGADWIIKYDASTESFETQERCDIWHYDSTSCTPSSETVTFTDGNWYSFRVDGDDESNSSMYLVGGETSIVTYEYYEEDALDSDLTLYAYNNVTYDSVSFEYNDPAVVSLQSDGSGCENAYSMDPQGTPVEYTIPADTMVLTDTSSNEIVFPSDTSYGYCYLSNLLDAAGKTALEGAADKWSALYDASVSYTWETGTDSWYQKITLTDSNNDLVVFDKPIRFKYKTTDAFGDEKLASVEYWGFGDLYIPWFLFYDTDEDGEKEPISWEEEFELTQQEDFNWDDASWRPAFTIPDYLEVADKTKATLTRVSKTGDTETYYVRQLTRWQELRKAETLDESLKVDQGLEGIDTTSVTILPYSEPPAESEIKTVLSVVGGLATEANAKIHK